MALNGWVSVWETEKPESGEDVLTLSYDGPLPPPDDPFADAENRGYCVATYYCAGDMATEEVLGSVERRIPGGIRDIVIQEEGFYIYDCDLSAGGACRWRRLAEAGRTAQGVAFWKRLDWPTAD